MTGWTGVTTLQRKRRCHLQESKSGITEALSPIGNKAAGGLKTGPWNTNTAEQAMKKRTEPITRRTVIRITAASNRDKRHTPAGHQTEGLDSTQNLTDIESGTSQIKKQFMKDYRRQSAARRS